MSALKAVLAGNPNSGKTTLFNLIAGTHYKVANYPGVTVEKKEAKVHYDGNEIILTDLPGTYSLTAYSLEEVVARDFITTTNPDIIVDVVDASNLERNLYLAVQLMELDKPLVLALNMIDMAEKRNIRVNAELLSEKLGVPVVKTIARDGVGKKDLLEGILKFKAQGRKFRISYGSDLDPALEEMEEIITENAFLTESYPARWTALKYLENDAEVMKKGEAFTDVHSRLSVIVERVEKHLKKTLDTYPETIIADYRYGYLKSVLKDVVKKENETERLYLSDKADRLLTNRVLGPVIMIAVLYGLYEFTFWASETPVGWLESFFGWLGGVADAALPEGLLKSLVISGIIDGVGGVLGFAPLILFMFFIIAILEDTGYMTRIAYMLDRVFRAFGLQGSSVVPYIVAGGIAGGCAIPGVMAARTIKGTKERLLTILTAPFMACGAKLPVYALLIAAFWPGSKGGLMLGITLASWLLALIMAKLLGMTIVKGDNSVFIMELPPYRIPTLKGLLFHAWEKTWMYVRKAGTFILAVSVILWALMTFPGMGEERAAYYEDLIAQVESTVTDEDAQAEAIAEIENLAAAEELRGSYAGMIGTSMEPVSKLAGFDWRTNIAVIAGIAAKEVVVSTLGTAYSLGEVDVEEFAPLSERLANDPDWSKATALALIVFTMMYAPCFVTMVVIVKETGSRKWGAFTLFGYTIIAFIAAAITYNIASLM
jgi:ferrous iron transport protein B